MENITGKRYSFIELLDQYDIQIPIIQRDYAQGRVNEKEVRTNFLTVLHKYLKEDRPSRDLDFVYGSKHLEISDDEKFIPLDGQQRLTTLFLLHWYIANKEEQVVFLQERLLKTLSIGNLKSKFTYETRPSSREFCDALMNNSLNIKALLPSDIEANNALSKTIKNQSWYHSAWVNDPTIKSMLIMLDAIHEEFEVSDKLFERLVRKEAPIITFLFLDLDEANLSDDLYIKMNARGVPLSPFEHFKAEFEKYVKSVSDKFSGPYYIDIEQRKAVDIRTYFSYKLDTSWADLIWAYKDSKEKVFDKRFMNFIRAILTSSSAAESYDEKLEYLMGTQVARKKQDYTDNISFYKFNKLGVISQASLNFLISAFDQLYNGLEKVKVLLPAHGYYDENLVFEKVLSYELNYLERIRFHAYIKYLMVCKNNHNGLYQWMRVIYNLTENTVIDSAEHVSSAIKSIEKLLSKSIDILSYLRSDHIDIDFFYSGEVYEEQIKAKLLEQCEWQLLFEKAETHKYFRGQIGFILDFSGIKDAWDNNDINNWTSLEHANYQKEFEKYYEKVDAIFSKDDLTFDNEFYLERAVLSKGDYLVNASAWRKNFLSTNVSLRDYSWHRLLRLPPRGSVDINSWHQRRLFVREVLDHPNFNFSNLESSLSSQCLNGNDAWRNLFISDPRLIAYCKQGFIKYSSSINILLYGSSQQNHKHRELYSYKFFLDYLMQTSIAQYEPFTAKWYYEAREANDRPCAVLDGYIFNDSNFAIDISFGPTQNVFSIRFFDRNRININANIEVILTTVSMKKVNDYSFEVMQPNAQKANDFLLKLCQLLGSKAP